MTTDTSWRHKSIGDIFSRSVQRPDVQEERQLALPQVNLLPSDVAESIALRKIRRASILGLVLLFLVAALVWALQIPGIRASQDSLSQAQATNAAEQAQVQALAPIAQMVAEIKRQQSLVNTTMATQPKAAAISWRLFAAAASAGAPAIQFTTLSMSYTPASASGAAESSCPDPDPFAQRISIGCVTFSATAASREQVSRLLTALGKDPLFVGPYVNSSMLAGATAGGQQSVSFTGTVGISPIGLVTPLTKEQKALLLNPPADSSNSPGGGQ
ncbi:MAG: hypothetical protein Q7K25_10140 [Actinomycetota bacterium]|nr:hypothetical protein [Actinomycetota bacterium]